LRLWLRVLTSAGSIGFGVRFVEVFNQSIHDVQVRLFPLDGRSLDYLLAALLEPFQVLAEKCDRSLHVSIPAKRKIICPA
jgi:hypothetical protein